MPIPSPKKPVEVATYGFVLDLAAEPSTAADSAGRSDVVIEVRITNDGQPFFTSRMAWVSVLEPVVKWMWDQFATVTGSKYFAKQGLTHSDVVQVAAMLIKVMAELNRRATLVAKSPGDKAAATERYFRSV